MLFAYYTTGLNGTQIDVTDDDKKTLNNISKICSVGVSVIFNDSKFYLVTILNLWFIK